ncbi:histidine phosphatase family protein [Paenibacillus sp. GYB006]|uniref:histidine phosphatase family protein n=1 Tax=Paenibacillus sp. GYB006 TaxID=2994394 RepID=UPI002F963B80
MIYVIRHGQTDLNKEGRLQGRKGLPLNEYGIKQAEISKEEMNSVKFDYVFSSPQIRAIQTAEIVSGMKATIDARLDVFDLGDADLLHREEVIMSGSTPDPAIYQGVEDVNSYIKRVFQFMNELESMYGNTQVNILLSGHRCTTGCIGAYFLGTPEDGNLLKFASANGKYKTYQFASKETIYNS